MAWTMEGLQELNKKNWAGIFRFTAVAFDTLYDAAPKLFEQPLWYRPDSAEKTVPLFT